MRLSRSSTIGLAILLLTSATSQATTIVYTDRDAFLAVAGAVTVETFDVPTICQPTQIPVVCTANYETVIIPYDNFYAVAGFTAPFPSVPVSLIPPIVLFTHPTLMFGLDVCASESFVPFPSPEATPLIAVNGYPIFESGCTFLGFQTDGAPYTGFGATAYGGVGTMDNLTIAVPEPSIALCLIGGMLTVAARRRRQCGRSSEQS